MARVLVLTPWYLPGYKAGGPIPSVANIVLALKDEHDFSIVTTDRDHGETKPYPGIERDSWVKHESTPVFYFSPEKLSLGGLRTVLRSKPYDALYLNSVFEPRFAIMPLLLHKLGMIPRARVIVAPRGQLSPGALQLKGGKKRLFMTLARATGLYRNLTWHASSAYEAEDIKRTFGPSGRIVIAPNLSRPSENTAPTPAKSAGQLELVFVSRIQPKKNLHGALELLRTLRGEVEFSIYGPLEDEAHWQECEAIIATLPPNIKVVYRGSVPREQVTTVMAQSHVFYLLSFSENYGHVILEALVAGCPALISDQTAFRDLENKGVGWDLPLEARERTVQILQSLVDMDENEYRRLSEAARAFGRKHVEDDSVVQKNRELFRVDKKH
ncbi:MAG TPA: glycosyltransferase [Abditibacteriaceae bacterium]|jgi:glycosyltransferase involved in cell wall biosynthesis